MSDSQWFSARLKELRIAAGLTQPQLAEKAGMSKGGLADLEQGRYEPSWSIVNAVATALGVTPDAFTVPPAADNGPLARGRPVSQFTLIKSWWRLWNELQKQLDADKKKKKKGTFETAEDDSEGLEMIEKQTISAGVLCLLSLPDAWLNDNGIRKDESKLHDMLRDRKRHEELVEQLWNEQMREDNRTRS